MSSTSLPSVSVIVPVHNGGDNFRRCLGSLVAAEPAPKEIIVVADGDTDGSWRLAEDYNMRVLRIPESGGPAKARNLGANYARGDILFFVDADVTIPRDAVNQIADIFQQQSDLAAVIGSYDDAPFENNFLSQYKNLFHHYVHQTANADAATFWGACGAVRRDIFLAEDGYNEVYERPSIEDIELGYRLKRAGHRICLLKRLQVKHLKRWGVSSLFITDFFHRASVILVYLFAVMLMGALVMPWLFVFASLLMLSLLAINWDVYRFFKAKRGLRFALMVIPWHWFYFFYCGLAFAFGWLRFQIRRFRSAGKCRFNARKVV
jgi:glycosyltransferase involved in cell wall biosynthesis